MNTLIPTSLVEERLERIEKLAMLGAKELLNTKEVALLLGVSEGRIRHLASAHLLPYYKHGNRNYFKKSEIEHTMLQHKVLSIEEINNQAATYVATHRR
jgi:excisionase family DNA binding protein